MDWFKLHHSLIDFYEKIFFCNNDFKETVVIEGLKQDITLWFISASKVNTCMRKWCNIYVIKVVNEENNISKVSHPILYEFVNVFPFELLW